jgi:hypothetical protein
MDLSAEPINEVRITVIAGATLTRPRSGSRLCQTW